jgi:phage terminase large subunit
VIQIPPGKLDCLTFTAGLGFRLYNWQKSALANIQAGNPTAIVACNGAGKTSTLLAPAALWCLYTWQRARVVVTSASHSQLEKQFFAELSRYQSHPLFRGWKFLASEIQSGAGGYITGISVDHPGRAEGYHQREDSPVMLLCDEAKSVNNFVFAAFDKCTPTFKCYASSAGPAVGVFFECFTTRRDFWIPITVKSTDCEHIDPEFIERERLMMGEHSDEFRNKHLAEFVGGDGRSCIRAEDVRLAIDDPPEYQDGPSAYYIDWACTADGDEIVIAKWEGNRGSLEDIFRDNSTQAVRRVAAFLKARQAGLVYADAGGAGVVLNNDLWEASSKLLTVRGVNNGSAPKDPEVYSLLNAEQWTEFSRELEKRKVILPNDAELIKQLSSRQRTYDEHNRIKLERKAAMRARGLPSPDRADALIGAWAAAKQQGNSEHFLALSRQQAERMKRELLFERPPFIKF